MNAFEWVSRIVFGHACSSLLHPAIKHMKEYKKLNKIVAMVVILKVKMCDVPELPFENKVWMSTHDNVGGGS